MPLILVVDDDDTIRDTLYELISEEHSCHAAKTAEEALAWLETQEYDVVLTDISMPGLSGLELLVHVRQKYPRTPVIIISGISDREHAQGLMRLGAYNYLLKPFQLEIVEKNIKAALEFRKTRKTGSDDATEWKIV